MLLISRSGFVEENAVETFHHYGMFTCPLFLEVNFQVKFEILTRKIIICQYSCFFSTSSCRRPTCGSSALKDILPYQGQRDVLTSTRSSLSERRPLALGRGRILIPGFILSPSLLAVHHVAHSLPLGIFPSLRMRL